MKCSSITLEGKRIICQGNNRFRYDDSIYDVIIVFKAYIKGNKLYVTIIEVYSNSTRKTYTSRRFTSKYSKTARDVSELLKKYNHLSML